MAKYERFGNNGSSTLNGSITDVAASLVITSAATFPTDGNFRILIDSEIVIVTAISGTTFTITRGAEGTTPAAHANGATVQHILTADVMNFMRQVTIRKTSDESVTSNTTLQNDDELLFNIGANEVWSIELHLIYTGATGGDIKINLAGPTSYTMRLGVLGFDEAAAGVTGAFKTISFTEATGSVILGCSGFSGLALISGVLTNSSNAGAVTFQFAQGTSSGTATTVLAGSKLVAQRLA